MPDHSIEVASSEALPDEGGACDPQPSSSSSGTGGGGGGGEASNRTAAAVEGGVGVGSSSSIQPPPLPPSFSFPFGSGTDEGDELVLEVECIVDEETKMYEMRDSQGVIIAAGGFPDAILYMHSHGYHLRPHYLEGIPLGPPNLQRPPPTSEVPSRHLIIEDFDVKSWTEDFFPLRDAFRMVLSRPSLVVVPMLTDQLVILQFESEMDASAVMNGGREWLSKFGRGCTLGYGANAFIETVVKEEDARRRETAGFAV